MRIRTLLAALAALLVAVLSACGGDSDSGGSAKDTGGSDTPAAASGDTPCDGDVTDMLAKVCEAGKLTVSTDPAYPPQSSLNEQTGEYEGFDIDVATEIAHRLGVDVAWEAPSWDVITAGSWSGRWDTTVGSMTPTNERQKVLYFTQPYNYTPAVAVVAADNDDITDVTTDLDGKKVGSCSPCTYSDFLEKKLAIDGYTFDFVIDDAEISGYDTDTTALEDLVNGRLDAVLTSVTTAQGYIDAGNPVKIVGDPLFYEPLSVGFDKSSDPSSESLFEAVDKIVGEMHEDGTLTSLSQKWYGQDLTTKQE
ncbi:MAG TPA: transporter substrate-binding domain-containing protein [Nocardioides sp.]|uniref:transporter substrate-binding domain-containing protein n=1 Tax=Nocardioides sp. TaxID=35761 RepID=UPI002E3042C1|nr:transporter substrate-binding domain-containing protein [Nocardioides sp.]HEX5089376.1 transporter substrate-binding domain-containing protein [Nocardioides sp.]